MKDYFIGLMSGTSMDAIDAVLVDFTNLPPTLVASCAVPLQDNVRRDLRLLSQSDHIETSMLAHMDVLLGRLFAKAALCVIEKSGLSIPQIRAIGSHGQTLRHFPHGENRTSIQIADPNVIAEHTGITTVADFRRRDMAAGGQGAPMVPGFHEAVFRTHDRQRIILNIGGIANITVLPQNTDDPVYGFDTGPGNTLMDVWCQQQQGHAYDNEGGWARGGAIDQILLSKFLDDPYFLQPPPKSTGPDYFSLKWLNKFVTSVDLDTRTIQTTLCELTAQSIAQAVHQFALVDTEVLVCGGGVRNLFLMERLAAVMPESRVRSTTDAGVDAAWMEAMAFAWLARQTLLGKPGNIPSVTGSRRSVVLGAIYPVTS